PSPRRSPPFQMLHMRLAHAFQPGRGDALGKPKKPRLHVGRKGGDLLGDGFIEDFHSPGHGRLYLNFEIEKRLKNLAHCDRGRALAWGLASGGESLYCCPPPQAMRRRFPCRAKSPRAGAACCWFSSRRSYGAWRACSPACSLISTCGR